MPNLTQRAYTQNLQLARNEGYAAGKHAGRTELTAEMRSRKQEAQLAVLKAATELANANAQISVSLRSLIEETLHNV